jgi:hypothetical protein
LPSTILVTASDAAFFKLLAGLLLSLEAQRGSHAIDIGLFDLGLTTTQRGWVRPRITQSVQPGWDLDVPQTVRDQQPHLRALTVRPFLPRYFPGYEIYIWIDADVWLQNWHGVELYSLGAQSADIAVTPHTDRAYPYNRAISSHAYHGFVRAYGKSVADDLAPRQHMNAGIFAAPSGSPLWRSWASAYEAANAASGGIVTNDQIALNFACHRHGLKMQLLPALYNWQSHLSTPTWDSETRTFCEPHLPHLPISMLHLTHKSKDTIYEIHCTDGRIRRMSLQNPQLQSLLIEE